jgi:hypothetical protein
MQKMGKARRQKWEICVNLFSNNVISNAPPAKIAHSSMNSIFTWHAQAFTHIYVTMTVNRGGDSDKTEAKVFFSSPAAGRYAGL